MSADASERLRRLLAVIPLFADTECVSIEELERRAGVDSSTLLDDLTAITDRLDEPLGFVETLRVELEHDRVSLRSSHFLRPMRITVSELCALELGLAMLAASTPPDEHEPIRRARARLREAIVNLPRDGASDAWGVGVPSGSPEIVSALRNASAESLKARIAYRGANDTAAIDRVIHPYAVIPARGTWFIAAHCERSDGLRFFRVDRVERAEVLTDAFERSASFALDALAANAKPFQGKAEAVLVVRYSPRIARWIAEREGVSVDADGSVTVEHPLADDQWGVRHVLQYGPDAEVLSPPEMRASVQRVLTEIAEGAA